MEHCAFEVTQRWAGFDPELVDEAPARVGVGAQRVGLAAGAVQREDQLPAHPFAQGVIDDQRVEFSDELAVAAECEVGVDAVLEGDESQLLQAGDLCYQDGRVREFAERRATPELECIP